MTTAEQSQPEYRDIPPEDLYVKALSVQGGETEIEGEVTWFARIVMTGVDLKHLGSSEPAPRRQESVVLTLDLASALAIELREVIHDIVRRTPTPTVPATGIWSWSSAPARAEELIVRDAEVYAVAIPFGYDERFTVRTDFVGTFVHKLSSDETPADLLGTVFSGPRQVQALVSSLRKVVSSAAEKRRLEQLVSADRSGTAFGR
jgi:hypothetical protein